MCLETNRLRHVIIGCKSTLVYRLARDEHMRSPCFEINNTIGRTRIFPEYLSPYLQLSGNNKFQISPPGGRWAHSSQADSCSVIQLHIAFGPPYTHNGWFGHLSLTYRLNWSSLSRSETQTPHMSLPHCHLKKEKGDRCLSLTRIPTLISPRTERQRTTW